MSKFMKTFKCPSMDLKFSRKIYRATRYNGSRKIKKGAKENIY